MEKCKVSNIVTNLFNRNKISIEEHNKVKQENEQLAEKVKGLENTNTQLTENNTKLTEQKETLVKEIESLRAQHRREIVSALHKGCLFKDDEARNWSIDSYAKSNMDLKGIELILDQIRCARVPIQGFSELPGIK